MQKSFKKGRFFAVERHQIPTLDDILGKTGQAPTRRYDFNSFTLQTPHASIRDDLKEQTTNSQYQQNYTNMNYQNDKNQYSTARDTLILANALLNDCPELSDIWTIKSLNNGVLNHNNSNSFLWRTESIRGLHRSHFQMKSWDSVIYYSRDYVEADTRFSRELLAVTLGAESDRQNTDDTMKLVNWGADNYKTLLLYPALETIDRLPVELTDDGKVRVGVKENVYVTLPRDAILQKGMKGFSATVSRLDPLVAPIKEGERIGEITVYFNKKIVAKSELVALHDVQKSNFWRRQYQRLKALVGLQ